MAHTTVACLNCTDQLRQTGGGLFPHTPVHVSTADTACEGRPGGTTDPDLWGVLPNTGTDWLFQRYPDYTS